MQYREENCGLHREDERVRNVTGLFLILEKL